MKYQELEIYTDGGSRGNPGPAGIGVVIWHGNELVGVHAKYIGEATNNQAEYHAVLFALQQAKGLGAEQVDIYTDSELISSQLNREFKIKDPCLGSLFVKCWNLMIGFKKIKFNHITREKNTQADKLVNKAIDNAL